MRTPHAVAVAFMLAFQVYIVPVSVIAAADQKVRCTVSATGALPKVAGLKVVKSGTRPMPAEQLANWRGQSTPIIVDIDTDAPGGGQRYSYICASDPKGGAFVQRTFTPTGP
ncbi:hypothetical protein [Bradyrhizobium sp. CCBAU 45384]|uniref:hypothetical protein n=1 Tax=Bradyrhizobium sp. CCBAU 45384 TaxID=858428 RepID=UPI0023050AFD|nr:hypothetical protein [Bradyrhizobium sp. CCBAU 45384]